MKKTYLTISLFVLITVLANAHEFWLQPDTFFAKPGQVVPIQVLVGEYFNGERSEGKKHRIVEYSHWVSGTKSDLSLDLREGHYGVVPLKIAKLGTHLIAFANTNKQLSMRADSFLLYLQEEGLDHIIRLRQERGLAQTRSRESYRRCVKTLIQAGGVTASDQTHRLDTGMPLEIIPVQNPYAVAVGAPVDFQVLFEHKPLRNALIRYWNRPAGSTQTTPDTKPAGLSEVQLRTNADGLVRFRLKKGQNMVSLVHMVPTTDTSEADWQSFWGSLTFGCR
ncbi:DUF4198 domain-containing protein [Fibrella forsythiae]|uniref:DUF4198 domain-containing protein n=1 Tax=Fibrella forsythiae TaxID=2817061 RepID=A0ABS3JS51_9BACT|nr:DUF4198 domain-containing protein [Fibrella forsythiae]MBO0952848.1 DUF4198 domain-containing protein [Fibrella forsythiae]